MNSKLTCLNHILRWITSDSIHPSLPEFLFLIGTYFFPQVNIELVVRINSNQLLYVWRDDIFGNKGWHLPGSIIRPNESFTQRIYKLIDSEVNILANAGYSHRHYVGYSEVISDCMPCVRSHFISHVFLIDFKLPNKILDELDSAGNYLISSEIPSGMISNHLRYIPLLRKCITGEQDFKVIEY